MWSEYPGCYERHLQRRKDNLLFPLDRRNVSIKEINSAQKKDKLLQNEFITKFNMFYEIANNTIFDNKTREIASYILNQTNQLLIELNSVAGNLNTQLEKLNYLEQTVIEKVSRSYPKSISYLNTRTILNSIQRIPVYAQFNRINTPIMKTELVPSILSEDDETIRMFGLISRCHIAHYGFPFIQQVQQCFSQAIKSGFDVMVAENKTAVWHDDLGVNLHLE